MAMVMATTPMRRPRDYLSLSSIADEARLYRRLMNVNIQVKPSNCIIPCNQFALYQLPYFRVMLDAPHWSPPANKEGIIVLTIVEEAHREFSFMMNTLTRALEFPLAECAYHNQDILVLLKMAFKYGFTPMLSQCLALVTANLTLWTIVNVIDFVDLTGVVDDKPSTRLDMDLGLCTRPLASHLLSWIRIHPNLLIDMGTLSKLPSALLIDLCCFSGGGPQQRLHFAEAAFERNYMMHGRVLTGWDHILNQLVSQSGTPLSMLHHVRQLWMDGHQYVSISSDLSPVIEQTSLLPPPRRRLDRSQSDENPLSPRGLLLPHAGRLRRHSANDVDTSNPYTSIDNSGPEYRCFLDVDNTVSIHYYGNRHGDYGYVSDVISCNSSKENWGSSSEGIQMEFTLRFDQKIPVHQDGEPERKLSLTARLVSRNLKTLLQEPLLILASLDGYISIDALRTPIAVIVLRQRIEPTVIPSNGSAVELKIDPRLSNFVLPGDHMDAPEDTRTMAVSIQANMVFHPMGNNRTRYRH